MAVQGDGGSSDGGDPDELKTQFYTREGIYRLMTLSEYSRPNRVGYQNTQGNASVRVSFVNLPDPSGNGDRICFNFGRELYVYVYKGVKKVRNSTYFYVMRPFVSCLKNLAWFTFHVCRAELCECYLKWSGRGPNLKDMKLSLFKRRNLIHCTMGHASDRQIIVPYIFSTLPLAYECIFC